MNEKKFGKDEVIFREGDHGTSFFQIVEGSVGVYVNYGLADQRKLTELGNGQYFGEMAVIETWPRSTTIVAEEDTSVYEIQEDELNAYFKEQPDKIYALMKHLGGRIRSLTNEYRELNAVLTELRGFLDKKDATLAAKVMKYIGIYNASQKSLIKPSVESLREPAPSTVEKAVLPVESYRKGTVIFKRGELGDCMYAVHGGSVGIYSDYGTDNEQKLTSLMAGTFFGEMGMLDEEERSATAIAEMDETIVEIIHKDDLEKLFESNPVEVDQILRHLSHRLRLLTNDYLAACKNVYDKWGE